MMSEVLWFLSWLPLVLTAVSELPPPSEVRVTLDHSGYFLRWERGAGTPPGTSFRVQTQRSNNKWEPVSGCQQVQKQLTCNLTEAFREYLEIFKIQVEAQLKGRRSQPVVLKDYKPPAHLPPPEIDVTLCGSIFCVELLPPYLNPWDIYNNIRYEIQVDQQNPQEFTGLNHNVSNLALDKTHCFSFRIADNLLALESNFSQPVCVYPEWKLPSDLLIASLLCLLLLVLVAILALLTWTGSICPSVCLKRNLMPSVLTSISTLQEVLVSPWRCSLSNIRLMAPPAGSSRTSSRLLLEGTDEESSDATSGMSSLGACYAQRAGANPLSSSSSSSSSSLTSKAKSRSGSCSNQMPETSAPQPVDQTVSGAPAVAEQNPVSSDCLIGGAEEEEEQEEEVVVMNVGQDVNLLSLTFGQPEEEEEEEEEEHHLEELSALEQPVLPPPPPASAASSWTDEEQSNLDGDYMCRA